MQLKIEIDKKSIGGRLKTARELHGLTQEKTVGGNGLHV